MIVTHTERVAWQALLISLVFAAGPSPNLGSSLSSCAKCTRTAHCSETTFNRWESKVSGYLLQLLAVQKNNYGSHFTHFSQVLAKSRPCCPVTYINILISFCSFCISFPLSPHSCVQGSSLAPKSSPHRPGLKL